MHELKWTRDRVELADACGVPVDVLVCRLEHLHVAEGALVRTILRQHLGVA